MVYILLARTVQAISQVLQLLILVKVILSYFMDPYHPLRSTIDRLVEPLLAPIRRVIPIMGGFDFSPVVLIILIYLISNLLINILSNLR